MSGKVKVRDEHAIADQVRNALREVPASLHGDPPSERTVKVLLDPKSQPALVTELGSHNEHLATVALAAICAQHLSNAQINPRLLPKIDAAAERLLKPYCDHWARATWLGCNVIVLVAMGGREACLPCPANNSEFLGSLAALDLVATNMHLAAFGMKPIASAVSFAEAQGEAAVLWSGAFLPSCAYVAQEDLKAELVLATLQAMLRSGCTEVDVAHLLIGVMALHPDAADALLVLEDMHEHVALAVLIALCLSDVNFAEADAVRERTSDLAWERLMRDLRSPDKSADERLAIVRRVTLNREVGRNVSRAMKRLLELHPTNLGLSHPDACDEAIAEEISALAKKLGLEIVPTRLGWAS